jgi:hypothetical protein
MSGPGNLIPGLFFAVGYCTVKVTVLRVATVEPEVPVTVIV